jgi:FAD/FMN-containing dehydrogenase/Fe-S oxidoreductase
VDEARARIYDDLRGVVEGELRFEPLDRAPYAHDAGIHEIDPLGVVVPRSEDDVVAVVRYANENRLAIHARGAGTDGGGGSLGRGLIIDFSRHLRRIISISSDHVVVEPGVVLDLLNSHLAPLGRRLEPATFDSDVTTIGGMIGVDAAGARSLRFGSIGDQVERLRVVFAHGECADVGFEPWPDFEAEPADFKDRIVRKLQTVYRAAQTRLRRQAAPWPRNRAGYALANACGDLGVHLGRLLAGSEGTLALTLQAELRTRPLPAAQAVIVLPFSRVADAAAYVPDLLERSGQLASCDLFDRRSLRLMRDADPLYRDWIDEAAESVLTAEIEGDTPEDVALRASAIIDRARRVRWLVSAPVALFKRADCQHILSWRRLVEPLLMRFRGHARPTPLFDDVAVPPDELADVIHRIQSLLQRQNVTWTLDSRAGEGRLRFRPFLNLSDPGDRARLESLASSVYDIVLGAGGTISSSQGGGLLRTQFLKKQFGELMQVFREIKDAFDPLNGFNPGKVIGDDPHLMLEDLRLGSTPPGPAEPDSANFIALSSSGSSELRLPQLRESSLPGAQPEPPPARAIDAPAVLESSLAHTALRWPELPMAEVASLCQGCGTCRSLEPTTRMCPSFRAVRAEENSPRSQANLIRQVALGIVDPRLWGSDEFKAKADLCIHCKLCQTECPSGVDVSSLMLEAKAAYVENHGLPPADWVFSRIEMWARLGSRFPAPTNYLFNRRASRWLLERLLGISRHRVLPPVGRGSFTRKAARLGLNTPRPRQPGPRVVYFVDVFANYYDQELAAAVVAVLRHAGVNVYVPARQQSSGMAALVVGDIEHARDQALANLRVLADAVRDGYIVVCSEPTAALMLRQEYTKLTEDLDAELVAAHTMDIGQFLMGLDARGQLPAPHEPLNARVGYHQPCHLRALDVGRPGLELIKKIEGLDIDFIDRGCSGMGGTYGLARNRFWTSLRAGRGLLRRLRDTDLDIGATECGACRIQMEQGLTKRTLHPIKLLSMSYGLSPELRPKFKSAKPKGRMS